MPESPSKQYVIEVENIYFAGVVCGEKSWGAALLRKERLTREKKIYPVEFIQGTSEILAEVLELWDLTYAGKEFAEHKHGLQRIIVNKVSGFDHSHPLKASFPKGVNTTSQASHPVGLIQKWCSDLKAKRIDCSQCRGRKILEAEINSGVLSTGTEAMLLANMAPPRIPQGVVRARASFV